MARQLIPTQGQAVLGGGLGNANLNAFYNDYWDGQVKDQLLDPHKFYSRDPMESLLYERAQAQRANDVGLLDDDAIATTSILNSSIKDSNTIGKAESLNDIMNNRLGGKPADYPYEVLYPAQQTAPMIGHQSNVMATPDVLRPWAVDNESIGLTTPVTQEELLNPTVPSLEDVNLLSPSTNNASAILSPVSSPIKMETGVNNAVLNEAGTNVPNADKGMTYLNPLVTSQPKTGNVAGNLGLWKNFTEGYARAIRMGVKEDELKKKKKFIDGDGNEVTVEYERKPYTFIAGTDQLGAKVERFNLGDWEESSRYISKKKDKPKSNAEHYITGKGNPDDILTLESKGITTAMDLFNKDPMRRNRQDAAKSMMEEVSDLEIEKAKANTIQSAKIDERLAKIKLEAIQNGIFSSETDYNNFMNKYRDAMYTDVTLSDGSKKTLYKQSETQYSPDYLRDGKKVVKPIRSFRATDGSVIELVPTLGIDGNVYEKPMKQTEKDQQTMINNLLSSNGAYFYKDIVVQKARKDVEMPWDYNSMHTGQVANEMKSVYDYGTSILNRVASDPSNRDDNGKLNANGVAQLDKALTDLKNIYPQLRESDKTFGSLGNNIKSAIVAYYSGLRNNKAVTSKAYDDIYKEVSNFDPVTYKKNVTSVLEKNGNANQYVVYVQDMGDMSSKPKAITAIIGNDGVVSFKGKGSAFGTYKFPNSFDPSAYVSYIESYLKNNEKFKSTNYEIIDFKTQTR